MTTPLRIKGAIDRHLPDPFAPHDPMRAWIGGVAVAWTEDSKSAAILKVATGRGSGDQKWGQHVLVLWWFGDPPPPEVAQAVYDLILDGGPGPRSLDTTLLSQPSTPAQPSYRAARA